MLSTCKPEVCVHLADGVTATLSINSIDFVIADNPLHRDRTTDLRVSHESNVIFQQLVV